MKQLVAFALTVSMVAVLAFTATAQQTGPTVPSPSTPAQTPSSGGSSASGAGSGSGSGDQMKMATIDCPHPTASGSSSTTAASSGSGSMPSASGSAGTASPPASVSAGAGQAQRVEGEIKNLDASGKTFEIGDVKLEWDTSSAILVDCQKAAATDLKDGAKVKAAYEVRDGKNVLTILEAEKK